MFRKPWPIIFITLVFCLFPILNIYNCYYSSKNDQQFIEYILYLLSSSENFIKLLIMVVPSLIAAFAVYSIRKWSYAVFLVCIAWITIQILHDFSATMSRSEMMYMIAIPLMINLVCVSYLLLPEVRVAYFDKRLHWWETRPRYLMSTEVLAIIDKKEVKGKTTNISEGGMFIILPQAVDAGTTLELKFVLLGTEFKVNAKVVYASADGVSHGVQFIDLMAFQERELAETMKILARAKYKLSHQPLEWSEDLFKWLKTLFATGEGVVPTIYKKQS